MMAVPALAFAQEPLPLWWCAPLRLYYPTVTTCPAPWLQVARPRGLSQAPPQVKQTSDPRCELIVDRARRDACFSQGGIPVVHCSHPQNADDAAFCREAIPGAPLNRVQKQTNSQITVPAPQPRNATSTQTSSATAGQPFVVTLEATISDGLRPVVTGTTNLPDDAALLVSLRPLWAANAQERLAGGLSAC